MSGMESDPMASSAPNPPDSPPSEEAERHAESNLSYEGSRVPLVVVVIWLVFVVWGLAYLVRWVPESWREWFTR